MNDGTMRVTIIRRRTSRNTTGLHLCDNCVTICLMAWPSSDGNLIAASQTPWAGTCDLCRYVETLSGMLSKGGATDGEEAPATTSRHD